MMKMDFDKEAREIIHGQCFETAKHFCAECSCAQKITQALRQAFIEGQRNMRERAAATCEAEAGACYGDIVEGDEIGRKIAHGMITGLLNGALDIRSLPLLEEPNKEVAG